MSTFLFTHPACLEHDTGDLHPERADRIRAIMATLEAEEFSPLVRQEAPRATMEHLLRAHSQHHIDTVLDSVPGRGHHSLDPDTILSPGSGEAALRCAGAGVAAVDAVASGRARNAFCAVRPPGHHAGRDSAMGFCLFSNAAIAALHARAVHGFERVAVVDVDVHHGNGTQEVLWRENGTLYVSTHQEHSYPNTGSPEETGDGCVVVNLPLHAGCGSEDYRLAFTDMVLPRLRAFEPDFLIVSAGFDAHAADPLAHLRLKTGDFGWIARHLCDVASETAENRIVSILEGGYDLGALAASVADHVRALLER
jgi:acetoin utilization deacetylase AcuC-like enzyme